MQIGACLSAWGGRPVDVGREGDWAWATGDPRVAGARGRPPPSGNPEMKRLRNLAQGFHKPELLPLSNYSLELGLRRGWGTASGHHCPSCPLPGTHGNLRTTNTGGASQPRAGQAAPCPLSGTDQPHTGCVPAAASCPEPCGDLLRPRAALGQAW